MVSQPIAGVRRSSDAPSTVAAGAASTSFEQIAGLCAIATGVAGLLYAVSFLVLKNPLLSALFLLLGGVLSTAALVALSRRVRDVDPSLALWALLLGVAGALGSAAHAGSDLANALTPPAAVSDLPSPVDPRGLFTFGIAALAVGAFSWLIVRSGALPQRLGLLGYLLAVLLAVLYLGRLLILDPTSPIIAIPAVLAGVIVNPVWYVWLGLALRRPQVSGQQSVAGGQ